MRLLRVCRLAIRAVLLATAWSGLALPAGADAPFTPQAWRQAPESGPEWSREPLARRYSRDVLAAGARRPDVLAALGPPGQAEAFYDIGLGLRQRRDTWRLSARNDSAYEITWDAQDRRTGEVLTPGCRAEVPAAQAVVAMPVLQEKLLKADPGQDGIRHLTVAQFEALLGVAGTQRTAPGVAGHQHWLWFTRSWRVAGEPHRYLVIGGHIRHPNQPPSPQTLRSLDEFRIASFVLLTVWPQCLAR